MLVSSFNLAQSFNYTPYLFHRKRFKSILLYMDPVDVDLSDALTGKPIFFTSSSTSKEEGGGEETMGGPLNLHDLQKFKKAVQVPTTRTRIWKH
jgi:hypothetical protein